MARYTVCVHNSKRNFIIFTRHRRLNRLWQFFFTGWGLACLAALVAGALFTRQLLWTPISAINMMDIVSNQFKMSGASFTGIDKNGQPFKLHAATGRQEYDKPDIIYMETVSGTINRISDGVVITDNINAKNGEYNRAEQIVRLIGDVRVLSSNGDRLFTKELVIRL